MARLIQTGDTPAKERNKNMRTGAEILRLLAQRPEFDEEAHDMVSYLVFCLRDIYRTIDESANAWDERTYWKKAEGLRHKWRWARIAADELEKLVRADNWYEVPHYLISLIPHFSGITVTSITRDSDWWCGAHRALLKEKSAPAEAAKTA
ncbi:MAG: hypothetical protein KDD65_18090 [Bacteroidetes bacterium]|nr:hypothetical protein [Bacteroidota bacterium]